MKHSDKPWTTLHAGDWYWEVRGDRPWHWPMLKHIPHGYKHCSCEAHVSFDHKKSIGCLVKTVPSGKTTPTNDGTNHDNLEDTHPDEDACVTVVSSRTNQVLTNNQDLKHHLDHDPHRHETTTPEARASAIPALQQAWQKFNAAVGIPYDPVTPPTITTRQALHAYYDRLLFNNRSVQLAAAQSWMQWEATVFILAILIIFVVVIVRAYCHNDEPFENRNNDKYNNIDDSGQHCVFVGRYENQNINQPVWGFRNHQGKLLHQLPNDLHPSSPTKYIETLRKNLTVSRPNDIQTTTTSRTTITMRPVQPIPNSKEVSSTQKPVSAPWENYIPAQAILTCFYSVNDRFVMNHTNLLHGMDQIQHIPCIAVHGGLDPICPIDSALDLWNVYPSMELRIPLGSGHSMYDAAIANELLMATDYLATQTQRNRTTITTTV